MYFDSIIVLSLLHWYQKNFVSFFTTPFTNFSRYEKAISSKKYVFSEIYSVRNVLKKSITYKKILNKYRKYKNTKDDVMKTSMIYKIRLKDIHDVLKTSFQTSITYK